MGHTNVEAAINVYIQVLDRAMRYSANRIGSELAKIDQTPDATTSLTH
jgi:hypothetical protein